MDHEGKVKKVSQSDIIGGGEKIEGENEKNPQNVLSTPGTPSIHRIPDTAPPTHQPASNPMTNRMDGEFKNERKAKKKAPVKVQVLYCKSASKQMACSPASVNHSHP